MKINTRLASTTTLFLFYHGGIVIAFSAKALTTTRSAVGGGSCFSALLISKMSTDDSLSGLSKSTTANSDVPPFPPNANVLPAVDDPAYQKELFTDPAEHSPGGEPDDGNEFNPTITPPPPVQVQGGSLRTWSF